MSTSIPQRFFSFYKKIGWIFKILLFAVAVLFSVLWVIGGLAYFDKAVMFVVGCVVGFALAITFYPQIFTFITNLIEFANKVIDLI